MESTTVEQNSIRSAMKLLESVEQSEATYDLPFPMAVFGTLRQKCGNHHLMNYNGCTYEKMLKGFLPNFFAEGLGLYHSPGSSAPVEVYCYTPEAWNGIINRIDGLEGFSPGKPRRHDSSDEFNRRFNWYHRTLAMIRILPDDFNHKLFDIDTPLAYRKRDLAISPDEWKNFQSIPAWIYSSVTQNRQSENDNDTAILWY